ncbi:MAG: YhcH/YjgK/YiaL family protein [Lentisphaeria bacterium]|nr:YhcH/YjgK/YiaL family protein [Lentisphaeria bacterium]
MIYDDLENFDKYASLYPEQWAEVKKFLGSGTVPERGRHDLLPDGRLYVNVQHYAPHAYDADKLEYHRRYIDIQLLLLGEEEIVYSPLAGLEEVAPYTENGDCGMDRLEEGRGVRLPLKVGNFAVFFPDEGHMPGIGDPGSAVVKAVVKLRVD